MGTEKKYIDVLSSLKSALMRIANQDTTKESQDNLKTAYQNFVDFVEGYKTIIRDYPGANDVVSAFNDLINATNSSDDTKNNVIKKLVEALDFSIKEVNQIIEEKEAKTEFIFNGDINGRDMQFGNGNTQNNTNKTIY